MKIQCMNIKNLEPLQSLQIWPLASLNGCHCYMYDLSAPIGEHICISLLNLSVTAEYLTVLMNKAMTAPIVPIAHCITLHLFVCSSNPVYNTVIKGSEFSYIGMKIIIFFIMLMVNGSTEYL